jgi:hypothetical protein
MTFQSFLAFFNQGWVGLVIGLVIGVPGLIIGLLALKSKRPTFSVETRTLISQASTGFSGLEVHYAGKLISNLQRVQFVFWNSGREPIHDHDIPELDQLKFQVVGNDVGTEVLSAKLVACSRQSIGAVVDQPNPNEVRLRFNNLDHRDACAIEVLSTGTVDHVTWSGKVLGAKTVKVNSGFAPYELQETPDTYRFKLTRDTVAPPLSGCWVY